ncbi:MAG: hypothetical protein ACR2N2_07910 [Acidimicrobiia bacterium]
MTTYFVSIAATRTNFLGDVESIAKTFRVSSIDPVEAGERVLDQVVGGSRWMFRSAVARVTTADTGEVVAEISVKYPKAFGVPRDQTRPMWSLEGATH